MAGLSVSRRHRAVAGALAALLVVGGCSSRIAGVPVAAGTRPLATPSTVPPAVPTTVPTTVPSAVPTTAPGASSPAMPVPPIAPTTAPSPADTSPTPPVTSAPGLAPAGSPSPMLVTGDTIDRPAVPSGPPVTVVLRNLPTTYDTNSYQAMGVQTEMAALTQPSAYLVDPLGHVALDTDVVERVALSTDAQKVEYHINPKATWSDGVPVGCQDFYLAWLANTSRAENPEPADYPSAFEVYTDPLYAAADAPRCSDGGRTVTVTFSEPASGWRNLFAGLLPAHIVATDAGISDITTIKDTDKSGAVLKLAKAYNKDFGTLDPAKNPSAGPYALESASGSSIVLRRNPSWWGNPAGPERIRLTAAGDDATAVRLLRDGSADVTSLNDQNPSAASHLGSLDRVTRTNQIVPVADHIEFNLRNKLFDGAAGAALRLATFSCVDREAITDKVVRQLNPKATPLGNMLVQPWDPAYTDHYAEFRTGNVALAKKRMQQGGWTLGKDGVFARGATTARITLGLLPNPTRTAAAKLVQQQCKKAGIDIRTATLSAVDLLDGKFQAAMFGWSASVSPAGYADMYVTKAVSNTMGLSNKKVDSLFDEIAADLEPADQSARLNEIDTLIAASHVTLPLYDQTAIDLQSTSIHTRVTNNYFWGGIVWDACAWSVAG